MWGGGVAGAGVCPPLTVALSLCPCRACLFSLIPDASCCLSKTLEQICGGIGWQASVTAPLLGGGGRRLRPSLNAPAAFLTALCSPAYATTTITHACRPRSGERYHEICY